MVALIIVADTRGRKVSEYLELLILPLVLMNDISLQADRHSYLHICFFILVFPLYEEVLYFQRSL